MNADLLLAHYERITDAPDAIPRLRRFILDLAVRGKLADQNLNDEPASELLTHIATEKALLAKAGELRNSKAPPELSRGEWPFPIPPKWRWSRISEIGTISPRNNVPDNLTASFVSMPMISAQYGVGHEHQARPWASIKKGYTHFAEGDVGLAKITPCFENGKSTVFRNLTGGVGSGTTELHIVRPLFVNPDYIVIFLKCPHFIQTGIDRMTGTAGQKRVPTEYFASAPFPLPPLAEQRRIVAEVHKLMALCDRLEAARTEREMARNLLAASSLARVNAPHPDPASFQRHTAFTLESLTHLTTRSDQINAVRQTVLNLAVLGKLTHQDSEEDRRNQRQLRPAREAGRFNSREFEDRAMLFKTPVNWTIEPLSRIASHVIDCPHTTPKWTNEGVLCIKTNQVKTGYLDLSTPYFVSEDTYRIRVKRLEPKQWDILYIREGGILGVACLIPPNTRLCLGQRLMLIRASCALLPKFLELCLNSSWIRDFAGEKTTGGAAPRVNMSTVRGYAIPVPPLAEQHRIISRVDELLALCSQLEASLSNGEDIRSRLLDAVLHNALMANANPRKDWIELCTQRIDNVHTTS